MFLHEKYNLSKDVCFSFSACFVVFCYYLITLSIWSSILIFVTEKHFNISTLYKLLPLNNPMLEWLQRYLFILYHSVSLSIFILSRLRFISWSSLLLHCLTLFILLVFFYTSWNISNPEVFWCFQRDLERDHVHKKG